MLLVGLLLNSLAGWWWADPVTALHLADRARALTPNTDRTTLAEYLTERWLPLQQSRLRPKTYKSYKSVVDLHIVPRIGRIRLGIGQIVGYALQSSNHAKDGKLLVWLQVGTYVPREALNMINEMMAARAPKTVTKTSESSTNLAIAGMQAVK